MHLIIIRSVLIPIPMIIIMLHPTKKVSSSTNLTIETERDTVYWKDWRINELKNSKLRGRKRSSSFKTTKR
jgi:hypothetical protein